MRNVRQLIGLVILSLIMISSSAQDAGVIQQYINTYKDLAIAEMQRTGVPASIKLAQGIHETMAGTSDLVLQSNNHFGIKCKANWTGASVFHDDDARGECFRKYPSAEDSYRDHSDFLKNSQRYASLFKLDPTDYTAWAYGLKKAGYATNPRYPQTLIKLIEDYHLQDYTMIALGKTPAQDDLAIKTTDENEQGAVPPVEMPANNGPAVKEEVIQQPIYPEGEFKVNETRVVFVKKGTSYLAIAQQYNISLARIFEFNEMPEIEVAANDQLVYLQRKRKIGKADFHVVKPGETLWSIAQEEAIRLETLQEYNWMKDDMQPAVGETLSLRSKSTVMPKLALKDNYSIAPVKQKWGNN